MFATLGIVRANKHRKLIRRLKWLRDAAFSTSPECIEWPSARNSARGGYGIWHPHPPHRAVLMIKLGRKLVVGEQAQHKCDNPPCCNGSHIHCGTHADNMRDMVARGRNLHCHRYLKFGVDHHSAKLTPAKVRAIRARAAKGEHNTRLAAEFHVSPVAIGKVVNRRSWKKV